MTEALRKGGMSHGEGEEEVEDEEDKEKGIVPAEPVKPVMKATLISRGAIYSL